MKRKPSPPGAELVFARWQHLEFFQWFSKTFDAKRINSHPVHIKRSETFNTIPHGVGVCYHKLRGAEIYYQHSRRTSTIHNGVILNTKIVHDWFDLSTTPSDPLFVRLGSKQAADVSPYLRNRLIIWSQRASENPQLDFRQQVALAAILTYQPNTIHPSRR